jgi:sec-independent protein translocase protein TatB
MFGMGGSEIIVILIVALIFLGPDKLPEAAKQISKGIRDLKRSTRDIQDTIENDEHIGGAIRDLKSALRGDEIPDRPKKNPRGASQADNHAATEPATEPAPEISVNDESASEHVAPADSALPGAMATVSLPSMVGESAGHHHDDDAAVAAMIRPAIGTIAKGSIRDVPHEPTLESAADQEKA